MASSPSSEPPIQPAVNLEDGAGQPNTEQTQLFIETDPDLEQDDDADSALGGNDVSSTASLTESILKYRTLLGRTYQSSKTNEYWAPNDEQQDNGLDLFHNAVVRLLGDKLFLAPIDKNPNRVLDIATGTGIWAIDFADEFPETEVTATDIRASQPIWVPPNLKFEVDDMNLEWTWPENHFDFIHFRVLYGCVRDWERLYAEAFRYLKPGGWMQHLEMDTRLESDRVTSEEKKILDQWGELLIEAGEKTGCRFDIAREHKMKETMDAVGFIDIVEKAIFMPCGSWPRDMKVKEAGVLIHLSIEESLDGLATYLGTEMLGWSKEEVTVLVAKMRDIVKKRSNCSHIKAYVSPEPTMLSGH